MSESASVREGYGKALSRGFSFTKEYFAQIIVVFALFMIPYTALRTFGPQPWGALASFVFMMLAQPLATGSLFCMIKEYWDGKEKTQSFDHFLSQGTRYWKILFLTNLLVTVMLFGWTLLLVIPGIIFGVYYSYALGAVVFRDVKYKEAIDYSKSVIKGNWWHTFGFGIVLGLILIAIIIATVIVFLIIIDPGSSSLFAVFILSNIIGILATAFIGPPFIMFLLGLDERQRELEGESAASD